MRGSSSRDGSPSVSSPRWKATRIPLRPRWGIAASARQADARGFAAIWLRDVPFLDLSFGDVGQIHDPMVYAGWLAAIAQHIAIGTAGMVMTLRDPVLVVDYHRGRIFAGAALTTLLGVGAELAAPENWQDGDRVIIAGRDSAQDSINRLGHEMTRRNLNNQPTLTERPGLPVRIIVNRAFVLRPYQPLFFNRGTTR